MCNFTNIIDSYTKVQFVIHNEIKTKNIYPEIKNELLKEEKYKFDSSKNIEESINKIVDDMYKISKEKNQYIDSVIINKCKD